MDNLKIKELENRKGVLMAARNNIITKGIDMITPRGTININKRIVISEVIRVLDAEIEDINIQLEELTGLNEDRLKYLNSFGG